ncbi:hypothetical protein GR138_12655 [Shinella kummerowiae]|uniref:Uncharacterized protein n=1 Tax=Shinella kummerowiae TaxID=417745 RepID=A0A6N8SBI5_9HYPH|nr:hypothetical protein [Shinella kummerowiae]MXN46041.1 hypothetical protein [Shinella kummerowiae]
MTELIRSQMANETHSTWSTSATLESLSSATTDATSLTKFLHSAVVMGTVAAVLTPLPALAARQKFGDLDHNIPAPDDAADPSLDLIDEHYVYRSAFDSNSSVFENSGVLFKLQGGKITMRQHRTLKTNHVDSKPAARLKPGLPAFRTRLPVTSASTSGRPLCSVNVKDLTVNVRTPLNSDPLVRALENVHSLSLNKDALTFAGILRDLTWQPEVWADDSEVVFEWIGDGRHAVASIEGDGRIGYTLMIDGQFVSGADADASVTTLPADLKEYLTKTA